MTRRYYLLLAGAILGALLMVWAIASVPVPVAVIPQPTPSPVPTPTLPPEGVYEIPIIKYQAFVCGDFRAAVYATPESHRMIHYLLIGTHVTIYEYHYDREHVRWWAMIAPAEYVDTKLLCLEKE